MPSAKYAFSLSLLRFSNGNTAIDFSGAAVFLAEFLESGIAAQRVPERIEPKKGRRKGGRKTSYSYGVCNSWVRVEIARLFSPKIV